MERKYELYKGLQKPLVFKSFKGKFIYWGVGSIISGLILTMITASLLSIWHGLLTAVVCVGGGLAYTGMMQKKGLHSKSKQVGTFIISNNYSRYVK